MDASTPDRTANLLGALALAASDRLRDITEQVAGQRAAAPSALVALDQFLDGGSIDQLRGVVGLTHSGAVRLVDRLEAEGHVRRARGPDDRSVSLHLTPKGRRLARQIAAGRSRFLRELIEDFGDDDQDVLAEFLGRMLERITVARLADRAAGREPAGGWLCRQCDLLACGRDSGRCPTANAAREVLSTDFGNVVKDA